MSPRFDVTAVPVEQVDTSLTSWSSIIMMTGLAIALIMLPLAFQWLLNVKPYNRVAKIFVKLAFGALASLCVVAFGVLPIILVNRAHTGAEIFKVWFLLMLIAGLFRLWMRHFEFESLMSWVVTGVFVAFCTMVVFLQGINLVLAEIIPQLAFAPALLLIFVFTVAVVVFVLKR